MGSVFLHDQTNRVINAVGVNGRITIICPAGYNVKATCGEIERSAVADETCRVIFEGLAQGIWKVEISYDQYTVTRDVEVVTNYETEVEFITAEICIDYPYGSYCSCSNGIVEHKAQDTSGHWTCLVAERGTWTITCTNGIRTETRIVEITSDGQIENVDVTYFEARIKVQFPIDATCICYSKDVVYTTPNYNTTTSITTIVHEFVVPDPDVWTIKCTKNGKTETREIEISGDGQIESVSIVFFEATLDITYTAGYSCTCSMGGVVLSPADNSGHWVSVIPEAGTWTVTCTNGSLVKSETVDMMIDGETNKIDIDYFLAVIDVLYPVGTRCAVSLNGDTSYAPDTSGKWTFEAHEIGNYSIDCVTDSGSKSKTVNIVNDWQIEHISLTDFMATINVTYPANASCKCSDNTYEYKATAHTGYWTFIVPRTGTWTITAYNMEQSVSKNVIINGDGQNEEINIKFFEATIDIVYPAGVYCQLANSTGTIKYTSPDTSGVWRATVPRADTWTATASNEDQTVSASTTISSDGQTKSINVKFFAATINITYPSGAACTCTDGNKIYYAPDTSGIWTLTVPRGVGIEWMIKAVYENRETIKYVTVERDEQNISTTLKFFETGIWVTCNAEPYKISVWKIGNYGDKTEYTTEIRQSSHSTSHHYYQLIVFHTGEYEIAAYRVAPYVGIESNEDEYCSDKVTVAASDDSHTKYVSCCFDSRPKFTYRNVSDASASVQYLLDDGTVDKRSGPILGNWCIAFLASGKLTFDTLNSARNGIDVFVCGGGGNGGDIAYNSEKQRYFAGGGGGGGYRDNRYNVRVTSNKEYDIVIGGSGGTSSAFEVSARGGEDGEDGSETWTSSSYYAAGGKGGSAGGRGGNGYTKPMPGEDGIFPFNNNTGRRYGPGGGGGAGCYKYDKRVANHYHTEAIVNDTVDGGKDGGGSSATYYGDQHAASNSGGGGGGAGCDPNVALTMFCSEDSCGEELDNGEITLSEVTYSYEQYDFGSGGSGIVIIRNAR